MIKKTLYLFIFILKLNYSNKKKVFNRNFVSYFDLLSTDGIHAIFALKIILPTCLLDFCVSIFGGRAQVHTKQVGNLMILYKFLVNKI